MDETEVFIAQSEYESLARCASKVDDARKSFKALGIHCYDLYAAYENIHEAMRQIIEQVPNADAFVTSATFR